MRVSRNFRRAGACCGPILLAGLLALGGRPAAAQARPAAQATDTTPLQLVFVVFPDPKAAGQAIANMTDAQRGRLESYALVSKDKSGKVKVQEKHDKAGNSTATQRASKSIDGVVALLGRPPAGGDSAGRARRQPQAQPQPGAAPGGVSPSDMARMHGMLAPGKAAIIFVVEDPYANDLESSMRGAKGQVMGADVAPPQ